MPVKPFFVHCVGQHGQFCPIFELTDDPIVRIMRIKQRLKVYSITTEVIIMYQ